MEDRGQHKANDDFFAKFRKGGTYPGPWRYHGWDLMERVEQWAKKWSKDVSVCSVDDVHFASSIIVFILHRKGNRLWGTTCYVITQLDGQIPIEFFMYPSHRQSIQKALTVMSRFDPWDKLSAHVAKLRGKHKDSHFGTKL